MGLGQSKHDARPDGHQETGTRSWRWSPRRRSRRKPGEWILGRGWHQEKWSSAPKPNVEGFPFHDALSKVSPDNPVMLTHASGHAAFVNAKAMEAAGITRRRPIRRAARSSRTPPGGQSASSARRPRASIEHGARRLAAAKTPDRAGRRRTPAIDLAVEEAFSKGVTASRTPARTSTTIDALQAGRRRGRARHPSVGDGARQQREPARTAATGQGGRPHRQPPDDRGDQGDRRRRARLARRLDARPVLAIRRRASACNTTPLAEHRGDGPDRARERRAAVRRTRSAIAPIARC